ncbi:614_t:CDS:2 [Diversispora eburnea]|uniref:614_t:CDS:1 n=1 Tax=Diversispora eburnea TaxID=1213867 RepID=A0A9N8ZY60_9GLOM|nr:614_t:CDS:2 [Diversispora eburnea]
MSSSLTSSTSTTISSLCLPLSLINSSSSLLLGYPNSIFSLSTTSAILRQTFSGIVGINNNLIRIIDGDNVVVNQDSANAIIRLTSSGSKFYISLPTLEQKLFTQELSKELSNIIPCSDSRIKMNRHFQFDKDTEETQILEIEGDDDDIIDYNKDLGGGIIGEGDVISTNPQADSIIEIEDPLMSAKGQFNIDDNEEEENEENKGKSKKCTGYKICKRRTITITHKIPPPIITLTPITTSPPAQQLDQLV